MAYSNWGGKVFCNGNPIPGNCDQIPADITDISIYKTDNHDELLFNTFHAVVGNHLDTLALLYKDVLVAIYVMGKRVFHHPVDSEKLNSNDVIELSLSGVTFEISKKENEVSIHFSDTKGNLWNGSSGVGMGQGFEKWC